MVKNAAATYINEEVHHPPMLTSDRVQDTTKS